MARQAKGNTSIGLYTYMELDGYRARQSLVGLSARTLHVQIPTSHTYYAFRFKVDPKSYHKAAI